MANRPTPPAPIGAVIEGCSINNQGAWVSPEAAAALAELARASAAHAKAISDIANALKGADAHMEHGIHISNVTGKA